MPKREHHLKKVTSEKKIKVTLKGNALISPMPLDMTLLLSSNAC